MNKTRSTTDNFKAMKAFLTAKIEIDAMLARLMTRQRRPFDTDLDAVHWGDVGTLNHYASLMRQITDSAFKEGEHVA